MVYSTSPFPIVVPVATIDVTICVTRATEAAADPDEREEPPPGRVAPPPPPPPPPDEHGAAVAGATALDSGAELEGAVVEGVHAVLVMTESALTR